MKTGFEKPVVVLDCDGVLANWAGAFCNLAADYCAAAPPRKLHTEFYDSYSEISHYQSADWPGWDKKLIDDTWRHIWATPNWFMSLDPIDANRANTWAFSRLADQTKLYVVTARPDCAGDPMNELTQHWIENHFGVHTSVIACGSVKEKIRVIEALRPNFLIDDAPHVLEHFMSAVPDAYPTVVARDWLFNRTSPCDNRVRSLEEFARIVGVNLD